VARTQKEIAVSQPIRVLIVAPGESVGGHAHAARDIVEGFAHNAAVAIEFQRKEPLGTWAEDTVLQSRLMRRGIFDMEALRTLFRAHREGKADYGVRLWNLINLCAWADHWVGQSVA
jgi:hypothetical protein